MATTTTLYSLLDDFYNSIVTPNLSFGTTFADTLSSGKAGYPLRLTEFHEQDANCTVIADAGSIITKNTRYIAGAIDEYRIQIAVFDSSAANARARAQAFYAAFTQIQETYLNQYQYTMTNWTAQAVFVDPPLVIGLLPNDQHSTKRTKVIVNITLKIVFATAPVPAGPTLQAILDVTPIGQPIGSLITLDTWNLGTAYQVTFNYGIPADFNITNPNITNAASTITTTIPDGAVSGFISVYLDNAYGPIIQSPYPYSIPNLLALSSSSGSIGSTFTITLPTCPDLLKDTYIIGFGTEGGGEPATFVINNISNENYNVTVTVPPNLTVGDSYTIKLTFNNLSWTTCSTDFTITE